MKFTSDLSMKIQLVYDMAYRWLVDHGPSILIEYVRQGQRSTPANHVHAIVRDPRNDYGEDWLAKHYREQPHP